MTDKVMLTLADLGKLAVTADRNGTQSAFVSVAMQWAGEAQKEIERLRQELGECQVGYESGTRAITENIRLRDAAQKARETLRKARREIDATASPEHAAWAEELNAAITGLEQA